MSLFSLWVLKPNFLENLRLFQQQPYRKISTFGKCIKVACSFKTSFTYSLYAANRAFKAYVIKIYMV